MTNQQQGERMYLADPASFANAPTLPQPWLFAAAD